MLLCFISVRQLVAEAGGDPWAVNRTLQRGHPGQISSLAQAFHDAGRSTTEAEAAFGEARRRFEASWNRENGDHPINDAAEVRRATQSLGVQAAMLPKIASDLEGVAANLAESQRSAAGEIANLERQLEKVDHQLGDALGMENASDLSMTQSMALGQVILDLEQRAIDVTVAALHGVEAIRDRYSGQLQRSMKSLRVEDGYDAGLIGGLDGHEAATPDQAERDVHAALAGDKEAAARVNVVLNAITAEQLAGKAPLTGEQASMLSQLQAQQHGMTTEDLYAAEQRLGEQRGLIGNSWQLMSNPAIVFPKTNLKPGALQGNDTVRGSATQLPKAVLRELDAPTLQYDDPVIGQFANVDSMRVIADIVKQGNPSFQSNTDLDRRVTRKASTMLNMGVGRLDLADSHRNAPRDIAFEQTLGNMFAAVSPDHQVVHDALTGHDGERLLHNITHHSWADNGKAVASLFDWTEAAASGPEARMAGETASAYAAYVGSQAPDLLHLPGSNTLGEINPCLVQSMAHGLAPFISNIAGTDGALPEFGNSTGAFGEDNESGRMSVAKGIFSVLSTDKAASDYFNGLTDRLAVDAESTYAQALIAHSPNLYADNADLHDAMTLRGLVNAGIHNAVQADVENHHTSADTAQRTEYDHTKTAYELAVKAVGAGSAFLPGVGPVVSPSIAIFGQAIESDFVGPAPAGTSAPTDHPLPNMSIGRADRELLNAAIALGQRVEGIPSQYLIEGRIGTPDELNSHGIYAQSGEYDEALSRALFDMLTQIYGDDPRRPGRPDIDMITRYNAVTHDALPLK